VAVYQSDAEVDEAETADARAPGPLPQVEGHDWSAQDQAAAVAWQGKILQRVAEQVQQLGWEAPEEDIQQLGQSIANELLADFADLQRMRNDQDQVHRRATLAQLRTEFGSDLGHALDAVEASLMELPDGLGEVIVQARTRSGERLLNVPGIAVWLIQKSVVGTGEHDAESAVDESSEREQILRLAEIDIDAYHRERRWGPNRDMTGAERIYQIDKKRERAA
jgi:hypothetical protein